MKKTIIFMASLFLMLVLAGCNEKETNQNQNQQQSQKQETAKKQTKKQSLKELMGLGKTQKCTWQGSQGIGKMAKGTVYVAGEKFLQEIEYDENGQKMKSYAISDGQWMYTWSDGNKEGVKIKLEDMDDDGEVIEDDIEEAQGEIYQSRKQLQQDYDFECSNWKKDDSKFIPPFNVNFQDMSQMIQQMQQQTQQMKQKGNQIIQDTCGMCNSLPSSAKQECLKSCQ